MSVRLSSEDATRTEREMVRKLSREFASVISGAELQVLLFIIDRVSFYGWDEYRIPAKHFLEGVIGKDGQGKHAPINMSRQTLYRVLKALAAKEILNKTNTDDTQAPLYSVNMDWNFAAHMEKYGVGLSHLRDYPVSPMRLPCLTHETIEHRENNIENITGRACEPARGVPEGDNVIMAIGDDTRAAIAGANVKTKTSQAKKAAKPNATGYMTIFKGAWVRTFPTERFISWTNERLAAFKRAVDKLPENDRSPFIVYIVEHWLKAMESKFAYMGLQYPTPYVPMIIKQIETFYQAYQDHVAPNRVIADRIAKSPKREPVAPPPVDNVTVQRLAELEAENARLKETNLAIREDQARINRERREAIVSNRPTETEFGSWEDGRSNPAGKASQAKGRTFATTRRRFIPKPTTLIQR